MSDVPDQKIHLVERSTGKILTESILGGGAIRFAYETALGRSLWAILFHWAGFSALLGKYYDTRLSRRAIAGLMKIPGCRPWEREKRPREYRSFNDYFARKLKPGCRPFDPDETILVSPGDGRLTVYPELAAGAPIPVKGAKKSLSDLCGKTLPPENMAVVLLRLAPIDYHRYHYPCRCTDLAPARKFRGRYHSVNPVALHRCPEIYVENTRVVTELDSPVFGSFYFVEVGAFGVGSICQTARTGTHGKMDEKGYFQFGGSTIILVLPQKNLRFDADLIENSRAGLETLIRCGERIGSAASCAE